MKKSSLLVFLLAVVGAALPVWRLDGAPLKESDVCEQAAWFAHVDFDALRSFKSWERGTVAVALDRKLLAKLRKDTGFDLQKNTTGLTASGWGVGEKSRGVVVLRHNFPSTDILTAWFAAQPDVKHKGGAIYAVPMTPAGMSRIAVEDSEAHCAFVDFSESEVVIITANIEDVAAVRRRITATTAGKPPPAFFKELVKDDASASAVAVGYLAFDAMKDETKKPSSNPFAKNIRQGAWVVVGKNEVLQGDFRAQFSDVESASAAAQLGTSLVAAQTTRHPMLSRVKVSTDAQVLNISGSATMEELAQLFSIPSKQTPPKE